MTATITSPPKPNPIATRLTITCGDCVFFSKSRLEGATAPCASMGCPRSRAPCARFAPNVFSEALGAALEAKALRDAINGAPDASLAVLAMAIAESARLRAAGFKLGQLVYFNVSGQDSKNRDYLSNYYKARVLRLDKDGNLLLGGKGVTATINPDGIILGKAWEARRKRLIAKGAIFDPKSPWTWERKDDKVFTNPKYRPPWLDREIENFRASYKEAKATRQTHDYDSQPVKRGRGRPRKDGSQAKSNQKIRTADISAAA